jgi:hypothetical protein
VRLSKFLIKNSGEPVIALNLLLGAVRGMFDWLNI